jgi:hypothetical protein
VVFGDPSAVSTTASFSAAGSYVLRLTASDGELSASDDLTVVVSPAPVAIAITPAVATQGQTLLVALTGMHTHFVEGVTTVSLGPGIAVGSVSVSDAEHLTASITIAPDAMPGARSVTVTTGAEAVSVVNGFTVQSGGATSLSVTPDSVPQGADATVTITGRFTNFVNGQTEARFGQGVSVGGAPAGEYGPVLVTSPTTAIASLRVSPAPRWSQTPVGGTSPGPLLEQSTIYDPISDQVII